MGGPSPWRSRQQPPGDSERGCMVMTNPTPLKKFSLYFLFHFGNVYATVGDKEVTASLPPKPWDATKDTSHDL